MSLAASSAFDSPENSELFRCSQSVMYPNSPFLDPVFVSLCHELFYSVPPRGGGVLVTNRQGAMYVVGG